MVELSMSNWKGAKMTSNPDAILSRAAAQYQPPETSNLELKQETLQDEKLQWVKSILSAQTDLAKLKADSNEALMNQEWSNPLGNDLRFSITNLTSKIQNLLEKEAELVAHLRNPAVETGLQLNFDAHKELMESFTLLRKIGEEAQANIENSVWLSNLDWSRCRNEVELIESKILVANSQLRSANCDVMKKFNAKEYVNQE